MKQLSILDEIDERPFSTTDLRAYYPENQENVTSNDSDTEPNTTDQEQETAGLTGQNILKKPGGSGETPEDTLPFDPLIIENLRQHIVAYDMMLLKDPALKERVVRYLEEQRTLTKH